LKLQTTYNKNIQGVWFTILHLTVRVNKHQSQLLLHLILISTRLKY